MIDVYDKESLRLDLMIIQKAQQIRIVKRLQDTLINTIYRLYVDPILHKHVVAQSNPNYKNITTYQAIRSRFEGVEKGQLCSLVIQEYRKEMIKNNVFDRYLNTLKSILDEERLEKPTELKEKTRKKGKIQAGWEAQTWKKIISLLMIANYENPALESFRQMWDYVYPNNPLPVNKPGRKSKNNVNQEGSDDEECFERDEEYQQEEINQYNSNILLKQDKKQERIKNTQINIVDLPQQNCKSQRYQESYLNQNEDKNIICEEQDINTKNPQQALEQSSQRDIQQQCQLQFCDQISDVCSLCCPEAQKMQQSQQSQQQQQQCEESDDFCLECLQNNFNQQINNNQFLINKNLDQIDDYPNQSDQQGYGTYDQFKENSKIQLNILNNQTIDNNPSKLIAQLQTKEIQSEKNETKCQARDVLSFSQAEQKQQVPKCEYSQQTQKKVCDEKNQGLIQNKRIAQNEQEEYSQLFNVNHQNSQEKIQNKFVQLDKTESNKKHQQINNYLYQAPTDSNIKEQRFESLQNIKKDNSDKQMRTYSSQEIIDIKQETQNNSNQESVQAPSQAALKNMNQVQQMSTEKVLSQEALLQQLAKMQMNQFNNTFLSADNNQIQQLQLHLNNISQKQNEKLINYNLQLNLRQSQGEEFIKDTNSTQGCSCCDNNIPISPSLKRDSISNQFQKSQKKNFLLHQNPEMNNLNQQYELKQEDNLKYNMQNNQINETEKHQFVQSKCPHNSQKMNGFQIAKSQQTINSYFSEKIQQLEKFILKQQQEYSKSLEIQEQLRAENILFRRYFESQILNQNQFLGLLKSQPLNQTEYKSQLHQTPNNEQQKLQQIQQISQQTYQYQQNNSQYQQEKIHLINQQHQNMNINQIIQGDEAQNYFQKLKQISAQF